MKIEVVVFDVGGKPSWVELQASEIENGEVIRFADKPDRLFVAEPVIEKSREIDLKAPIESDEGWKSYITARRRGEITVTRITESLHKLNGGDGADIEKLGKNRYIPSRQKWTIIVMDPSDNRLSIGA